MTENLSAEDAMSQAVLIAGCKDFGADGFREGLVRSLTAFARMSLTPQARAEVHQKIVADLANRLRIEQWYKAHTEIEKQVIEGPIVVVGMPRTGTTATVGMLALDERFRFLRGWEANAPVPPPVTGYEAEDPRVVAAHAVAKHYALAHLHLFDPDGPQEDLAYLAGIDMHAYHGAYPMPAEYVDWWIQEDFRSTYAYLARIFKLLQSRRAPCLWLLKSPPHLFRLDAIVRQFPDARFVVTHRDPSSVIASVASLQHTLYEQRCLPGTVQKEEVGRQLLRFWKVGVERSLAARATIGEDRFVDVWNEELVKRPVEVFERIYAHIGLPITPELAARLTDYSSKNAPGTFGGHHYSLEEYGLKKSEVQHAFSVYYQQFIS